MNLIVRSSYSKIEDGSLKSNIGDLLRCTILFNVRNELNNKILTDKKGKEFLLNYLNEDAILSINELKSHEYKTIYYLDNFDWCLTHLTQRYSNIIFKGFSFISEQFNANTNLLQTVAYNHIETNGLSWQENLIRGVGLQWNKQDYLYPNVSTSTTSFKVGLNHNVNWETKQWDLENWNEVYTFCKENQISVSWQEGLDSLEDYINWIASCNIIITIEGLGLHIASSLKKQILLLSGPCESNEYSYNRIEKIYPNKKICMPCNREVCTHSDYKLSCLEEITSYDVISVLKKYLEVKIWE